MSKVHKITLEMGEGDSLTTKTFFMSKVKGRIYRKSLELRELLKEVEETQELTPTQLDEMMNFIVFAFGHQFTLDELYDGVELEELIPLFTETVQFASNPSGKSLEGK